jgi:hypothetical protein
LQKENVIGLRMQFLPRFNKTRQGDPCVGNPFSAKFLHPMQPMGGPSGSHASRDGDEGQAKASEPMMGVGVGIPLQPAEDSRYPSEQQGADQHRHDHEAGPDPQQHTLTIFIVGNE